MTASLNSSPKMSFADVVDKLSSSPEAPPKRDARAAQTASGSAAQAKSEPAYVAHGALTEIYRSTLRLFGLSHTDAADKLERVLPQPSTKPEDIARELKIRGWHTEVQLHKIRRRFAMKNHPDRVPSSIRSASTMRMGIANMLIDQAIRKLKTRR